MSKFCAVDGIGLNMMKLPTSLTDAALLYFRAEGKIKHCKLKREGRLFTIGTAQFESLIELVEFYTKHPLYKGMKLRYAINEAVSGQCD